MSLFELDLSPACVAASLRRQQLRAIVRSRAPSNIFVARQQAALAPKFRQGSNLYPYHVKVVRNTNSLVAKRSTNGTGTKRYSLLTGQFAVLQRAAKHAPAVGINPNAPSRPTPPFSPQFASQWLPKRGGAFGRGSGPGEKSKPSRGLFCSRGRPMSSFYPALVTSRGNASIESARGLRRRT
jgi:hypothetical protein